MRNKKIVVFWYVLTGLSLAMILMGYQSQQRPPLKSYEQAARNVIEAYQKQDMMALKSYYGKEKEEILADTEIEFEKKFYLAVDAVRIAIVGTEELLKKNEYAYIGISFDFVMKSGEMLPYYEYFIVYKVKNGNYRIITVKDAPRDIVDYFEENSDKMQETKLYQSYKKREKEYADENPKGVDWIYEDFEALMKGIPRQVEKSLRLMSIVFLMAIIQLWILCCWVYVERAKNSAEATRKSERKISKRLKKK